jgi:hypothetical protein
VSAKRSKKAKQVFKSVTDMAQQAMFILNQLQDTNAKTATINTALMREFASNYLYLYQEVFKKGNIPGPKESGNISGSIH